MTAKKLLISLLPGIIIFAGFFVLIKGAIPSTIKYFEQQEHINVEAEFLQGQISPNPSAAESTDYLLEATYAYTLNGQEYILARIEKITNPTNNAAYDKSRLENTLGYWQDHKIEVIRINPQAPTQFQYDEVITITDLVLIFLFSLIFIIIGGALISRIFWPKQLSIPEAEPWTIKKDWRTNVLSCNTRSKIGGTILFTIIWNSISALLCYFIIFSEQAVSGNAAYLILIFPLVGVFILFYFLKGVVDYVKYGTVGLTMDPYPAAIGGHFGGQLHFKRTLPKASTVSIQLSCIKITRERSGDDHRIKEELLWQTTGFAYLKEKAAEFRLNIAEGLKESSLTNLGTHWRADITVSYDNHHFDRQFQIPVYKTGQLSTIKVNSEDHPAATEHASELINEVTEFKKEGENYMLRYPNFRVYRGSLLLGLFIGITVSSFAIYSLFDSSIPQFIPLVFLLIGSTFFGLSLFETFYSLQVKLTPKELISLHKWFGIPFKKKRFSREEISKFTIGEYMSFNSRGSKHTAYYRISVGSKSSKKVAVAIRLQNHATAEQMMNFFNIYYDLAPKQEPPSDKS